MHKFTYPTIVKQIELREQGLGIKLGLTRVRKVLSALHHPENPLRVIHIAGTNGKGSTAMFVARILEAAGYRVGLYLSPHVVDVRERIQINRHYISKSAFVCFARQVERASGKIKLTYFEFLTILALLYFAKQKTEFVVLETGLGGRLDATNVVNKPLVSIITNIDYEHTQYLGTRLTQIATEKGGIIKNAVPVVTGIQDKSALNVIKKIGKSRSTNLYVLGKHFHPVLISSLQNYNKQWERNVTYPLRFNYYGIYRTYRNLNLNLNGKYQIINVSLALATIELLRNYNIYLSEKDIRYALTDLVSRTTWPARMETISLRLPGTIAKLNFILDGAHNPAAIKTLIPSLPTILSGRKLVLITGMLADKNIVTMINYLAKITDRVIIPQMKYYRAQNPGLLAAEFNKYIPPNKVLVTGSVKEAVYLIAQKFPSAKVPVLVTGSFYLVSEFKSVVKKLGSLPLR